ncbi:MAG: thiamine phosphate synthase [Candidatus Acidiferrales bacterium]
MARLPESRPLLYYITDRRALAGEDPLPVIQGAVAAGVEMIQLRERELSARELLALAEAVLARCRGSKTRLLVNDRLDVALAAGTDGLHLPSHGLPVGEVRRLFPEMLLGASCHNVEEVRRAEDGGADFVVFGPVFETASKRGYGPPVGVENLEHAARAAKIPVLALGGITLKNAGACLAAGAAGMAAISLFQNSQDIGETVCRLRALASGERAG